MRLGTRFGSSARVAAAALIVLTVLLVSTIGDRGWAPPGVPDPSGPSAPPADSAREPRGAAPLGSAGCEPREGATYVDPDSGSDAASGGIDSPLRTVAAAVRRTPERGTVVMRGGEYHESVVIEATMTLCALRGEVVWFDGSRPLTEWSRTETGWTTPWPHHFDSTPSFTPDALPVDPFVDPARPMAAHPDLVLADGTQLTQVEPTTTPGPDQFTVNPGERTLTIGTDPAGREIRAADLQRALVAGAPDVRLEGFGVRRYANSVARFGAVYLGRPGNVARDVVVEDVATTAFTVSDDTRAEGGSLENVTVRRAGMLAVHANWADGLRITGSRFEDSNREGFNPAPVAGAIKVTRSRRVTIENNEIAQTNDAAGIWLDEAVVDFTIRGNRVTGGGAGVLLELSSSGAVTRNDVTAQDRGIVVYNSGFVLVEHNHLSDIATADLWLAEDHRRQSDPEAAGHDPRFPPGDPTNTWRLHQVRIVDNVARSSPLARIFVFDPAGTLDPSGVGIRDNEFISPRDVDFVGVDERTRGMRRAALYAGFGAKASANVIRAARPDGS